MCRTNSITLPLLFFLFSTASLIAQNAKVFASPDQVKSFKRLDPLRRFEYYHGVYDVRNKHYWASTAFTGVHGYGIAGIWLLCGVGFGIFMIMKHQKMSSLPIKGFLNHHDFLVFMMVLLFTFLAIIASSVALLANQNTARKMENLKETIFSVGGDAQRSIRRVAKATAQMQHLLVPYDPTMAVILGTTTHRLENKSQAVQYFVGKNGRSIDSAIQASSIAHVVVITTDLALIIAAIFLILLHWYPGFLFIICLCWISTSLCWVLTGFDFFIYTFAKDTCSAFQDFELNPRNSSLGAMIPCTHNPYSDQMLVEVGFTVHNFINQLNYKIPEYYRTLLRLDSGQNYEHMSIFVNSICNPFNGAPNYSYVPQSCPKNTIPIGHLPNILASFTCYNREIEICKSEGKFVSKAIYDMALAYSRSTQDLLDVIPDLQKLAECKLVEDKFANIVLTECVPFCVAVRLLWFSMILFSILLVVLVLLWVVKLVQGI